jgi:hypothetical protein
MEGQLPSPAPHIHTHCGEHLPSCAHMLILPLTSLSYLPRGCRIYSPAPQWVTTVDSTNVWQPVINSSQLPSGGAGGWSSHSPLTRFSATCMYFGVELVDARAAMGLESVPIGLIQSAIGGALYCLSTCCAECTLQWKAFNCVSLHAHWVQFFSVSV